MTNEQKLALVGKTMYVTFGDIVRAIKVAEAKPNPHRSWSAAVDLYDDNGRRIQTEKLFASEREALEYLREWYANSVRGSEAQVRDVQAELERERESLAHVHEQIAALDKAANIEALNEIARKGGGE